MFPVGGVGAMLVIIAVAGLAVAALTATLQRNFGWSWSVLCGLLIWSVVVIGVITLIPANGAPGIVSAEGRLTSCSWDIGGPAPDGFWILPGGQRLLNAVVFVPSGALLVLVAARWRWGWVGVPVGLALLAGYSTLIELTQLALARIDRACDVTDIIDNVTGAAVGVLLGIMLLPLVRPWRSRGVRPPASGSRP
jgi:glycopeptide antibiotics resistance protein